MTSEMLTTWTIRDRARLIIHRSMLGKAKPKAVYEFMKSRQLDANMESGIVSSEKKNLKRKRIEQTLKCVCAAETVRQLMLLMEEKNHP